MKKADRIILILLLVSPIMINYIILGNSLGTTVYGSIDGWLGYYGTIIGSLITMFVLYRTRIWNMEDNRNTRNVQTRILMYQTKMSWFEGLRKQLELNYRILNFHETTIATNNIIVGNNQIALDYLLKLNKDIEMQGFSFDLYLSGSNLDQLEKAYIDCYRELLVKYGEYINDLILICGIKQRIEIGADFKSYIDESLMLINKLGEVNPQIRPSTFHLNLNSALNSSYEIENIEDISLYRIRDINAIHGEKLKLSKLTSSLLKFEEEKIKNILLD